MRTQCDEGPVGFSSIAEKLVSAITPRSRISAGAVPEVPNGEMSRSERIMLTRPWVSAVLSATREGAPQAIRAAGTGLYVRRRRLLLTSRYLRVRLPALAKLRTAAPWKEMANDGNKYP